MLPIIAPKTFHIIAHRGASAYAPENTLVAFELAARMGATEVELDTQLATDGHVVLCHDRSLERYGHGSLIVEQMPSALLLALDMGSWFSPFLFAGERMITLETLFDRFGDSFVYHVELKGGASGLPGAVAGIIEARQLAHRCVITSFQRDALAAMRRVAPQLRLGWLCDRIDPEAVAFARELALFQLCPKAEHVTAADVAAARRAVEEVRAWGLSGVPAEVIGLIQRVLAAGCDGMTINWPDWATHESTRHGS